MNSPVIQEMLNEIGTDVQAIGRIITSKENDIDDLLVLSEALVSANQALISTMRTIINSYKMP